MKALTAVEEGKTCTVVWLIGEMGKALGEILHMEMDDEVSVVRNYGSDGMVIGFHGKKYAVDSQTAYFIKVNELSYF